MSKALMMTGFLQRKPQRQKTSTPLMGGVGKKPLTEQEIRWARERKEHAKAQRALNETLTRIRAEREQGTGGK